MSLSAHLGALGLGFIRLRLGFQLRLGLLCRQAVLLQGALQLPPTNSHVQGFEIRGIIARATCKVIGKPSRSLALKEITTLMPERRATYFRKGTQPSYQTS